MFLAGVVVGSVVLYHLFPCRLGTTILVGDQVIIACVKWRVWSRRFRLVGKFLHFALFEVFCKLHGWWLVWSYPWFDCVAGGAIGDVAVLVSCFCGVDWVSAPAMCVCVCRSEDQAVRLWKGLRFSWISATALHPCTQSTGAAVPAVVVTGKRARAAAS